MTASMAGILLYVSLGIIVLTVLSNRFWRRQLASARATLEKARENADAAARALGDANRVHAALSQETADAERRADVAERDLAAALAEYEATRAAPVERRFVLDHASPRPGLFYEAAVRYEPGTAIGKPPAHRAWAGVRHYLLIADSEHEARQRANAHFLRRNGFVVIGVVPCRLTGLTVSRIPELSTFRRSPAGEEPEPPGRTAPRRAAPGQT